jgi:hypothetical protein
MEPPTGPGRRGGVERCKPSESLPAVGTIVGVVVALTVVRKLLDRVEAKASGRQFRNQMIMISMTALGLLIIVLVLPIGDTMRGQVLGLIGVLFSAAIALSSTTVLGNAMADREAGSFREK